MSSVGVTTQMGLEPAGAHAPDQLVNTAPPDGVAVRVRDSPWVMRSVQSPGQAMPAPALVTKTTDAPGRSARKLIASVPTMLATIATGTISSHAPGSGV